MSPEENKDITYFAETDFRNKKTRFGIKANDRARHVYVIGKTGMGKSTMLENMAIQDIQNGNGVAFIDPHGKTAELLLDYVPEHRIKDVVYFAPHDTEFPISFNVMEDVGKDQRHLVASGLMAAFKKIWPDVWSARMEYISMNILLALLEYPGSTLLGVNRMLSDKNYRKKVVDNISDPSVKAFWTEEFAKYTDKFMVEASASIQNKFGQFTSNPLIRNLMGQPKSSFDLRRVMDEKKILIINLSKGRMGETNSNLIGGMLITKIYLAAMSRANASEEEMKELPPYYLFVDEFQSFVNDSFADILSEARKYKLNLTVAHQYIEQMPETVRNAVFGNVGTTIAFRVGPFDAEVLEKMFAPKFTAEDIVNLGFAQTYLTLMIDGVGSPPFSAKTLPPIARPPQIFREQIIENVRKVYARPRNVVEDEVRKWHEAVSDGVIVDKKFPTKEASGVASSFAPKTAIGQGLVSNSQKMPAKPSLSVGGYNNQSNSFIKGGNNQSAQGWSLSAGGRGASGGNKPVIAPKTVKITPKTSDDAPTSLDALRSGGLKNQAKSTGKNLSGLKSVLSSVLSSPQKEKTFKFEKEENHSESEIKIEPWEAGDSGADSSPFHEFMKSENFEESEKPLETVEEVEKEVAADEIQSATGKQEIREVPEDVLRKVIKGNGEPASTQGGKGK